MLREISCSWKNRCISVKSVSTKWHKRQPRAICRRSEVLKSPFRAFLQLRHPLL